MSIVNQQQKEEFLELGFIKIDNVISEKELNWLRDRYETLFETIKQKSLGGTDEGGKSLLPQVLGISRKFPEFSDLEYRKNIAEIATFFHGDNAEFRNDHAILKPAGYGIETPWHQDQAYHNPTFRFKTIKFWLPLQDATVEGGCMWYVPYTHGGAVVPHHYLNDGDNESAMVAENQPYWQANGVAVPCEAGSVVLHHSYAMHYAGPNVSSQPRRAYICVFEESAVPLKKPLHFPWNKTEDSI